MDSNAALNVWIDLGQHLSERFSRSNFVEYAEYANEEQVTAYGEAVVPGLCQVPRRVQVRRRADEQKLAHVVGPARAGALKQHLD